MHTRKFVLLVYVSPSCGWISSSAPAISIAQEQKNYNTYLNAWPAMRANGPRHGIDSGVSRALPVAAGPTGTEETKVFQIT